MRGWMRIRARTVGLVLCALGLGCLCAPAFAVEGTLVADAHVNLALPTMNSGTISNVNVGGGYTGLMQFDLSLLPTGTTPAQISRAVLRLYVNRVDTAGVVSLQPLNGAWSEYGVTYQTLPALGAAAQVFNVSQQGEFLAVDVTALVQAWVAAPATNNGFALTAGTAVAQFDSKENDLTGHPATLDIGIVSQGPAGVAGPQGPQGIAGANGAAGPVGAPGSAGPAGLTGAAGPVGPQGLQGNPGVAGPTGATGTTGPAGPQGPAGVGGTAGTPGLVYQGAYASATNYALGDVTLWQGASWVSLVAGNHGNTPSLSPSSWGVLTSQGPTGATGSPGPQGLAGPAGATGSTGPAGLTGPQGPQGIAGMSGATGLTGAIGSQGLQGPAGPQGIAGPVGLSFQGTYSSTTNYALADGVTYNGSGYVSLMAGNHGNTPDQSPAAWSLFAAAGVAGGAGATGPAGAIGPVGPAGPQGLAGPVGATGAVGPQGPPVANYLGNYASTVNYAFADAVSYGGSTYISLVGGNHGNTPNQSPAYWAVLAAQGPAGAQGLAGVAGTNGVAGPAGAAGATGPQGPPVSFIGGWLTTQAYNVGDAVSYGGGSYIALVSNVGREPDISPVYWGVLAQAGAAGPAGPAGATGLQGPTGFPGSTGPAGPSGATGGAGPAGPAGAVGPTGPAGSAGPQGIAGVAGLNWQGAYSSTTNYASNDGVSFQGAAYISLAASNHGNSPSFSPSAWSLLAAQGGAGANGSDGVAGPAGPTGPAGGNGIAATVQVGTVTTGAAGSNAVVTNSGTASAAVLNFSIPQGAAGIGGGTGTGSSTSGVPYQTMVHSVSYSGFYSINNTNQSTSETQSVLSWTPQGCTATRLDVFSQQAGSILVTLRSGTATRLLDTTLSCSATTGSSCTATGSVVIPAGSFLDLSIVNADSNPSPVWAALVCN